MCFYVVSRDLYLVRWVRVIDDLRAVKLVRFSDLGVACGRACDNFGALILVDWGVGDISGGLSVLCSEVFRGIRSRVFICVRGLLLLSFSDVEYIRFAMLQTGVGGVFSQLSELVKLSPVFMRYWQQLNPKKQAPFESAWDSLPWKKYAVKSEYENN
ncbi:MAG: hypothetical protein LBP59_08130 [Planctomycetaceae bacterium]|jgi:hypothetical protein|nr:hypothetical protein [Planctomycetaceae bacterium]